MSTLKARTELAPRRRLRTARLAGLPTEETWSRRVCGRGAPVLRGWPAWQRQPERTFLFSRQRQAASSCASSFPSKSKGGSACPAEPSVLPLRDGVGEKHAELRRGVSTSLRKQKGEVVSTCQPPGSAGIHQSQRGAVQSQLPQPLHGTRPHAGRGCWCRVPHRAVRPGNRLQTPGGLSVHRHQSGDQEVARHCESPALEPQGHRYAHSDAVQLPNGSRGRK